MPLAVHDFEEILQNAHELWECKPCAQVGQPPNEAESRKSKSGLGPLTSWLLWSSVLGGHLERFCKIELDQKGNRPGRHQHRQFANHEISAHYQAGQSAHMAVQKNAMHIRFCTSS
jgi:hypothetical protein